MQQIVIPAIEFRQANIVDVINFLREASAVNDPDGFGVNLILRLEGAGASASAPAPADDMWGAPAGDGFAIPSAGSSVPTITLNLRRVTLLAAIKYVTEVSNLKYRVDESAVIIYPAGAIVEAMITRLYPVMPHIIEVASESDSASAGAEMSFGMGGGIGGAGERSQREILKDFFVKMGVPFPPGSSISYNAPISQIIVANTAENLEKFEDILKKINVIASQVEIEARFVEINQDDLQEIGFNGLLTAPWQIGNKSGAGGAGNERLQMTSNDHPNGNQGFTKGLRFLGTTPDGYLAMSRSATTVNNLLGGILSMSSALTNPELTMVLHALDQKGGNDLLSAPRVNTRSGNNAQMQVVTEIIYPTEYEEQSVAESVNTYRPPVPAQFETRDTGILLNVT
ncbi:MAG: hypothetical protein U1E27_10975, partial [Kiritimatiellia bacterium]|nr:hypothetical protein [Kiritimatiellia bacterium]